MRSSKRLKLKIFHLNHLDHRECDFTEIIGFIFSSIYYVITLSYAVMNDLCKSFEDFNLVTVE